MAQEREETLYRVQPDGDLWSLSKGGEIVATFDDQETAIDRGQEMAQTEFPSQLFIHGVDGKVTQATIYRNALRQSCTPSVSWKAALPEQSLRD